MAKKRFNNHGAPSQRQLRIGEVIRRELSTVFLQSKLHDPVLYGLSITVGEVRASPDLKIATVFILPLGGGDKDEVLDALRRNKQELRWIITKNLRLKHSPELRFELDDTFDRMDETKRLLAEDNVKQDLDK
ncbi:MAG: 30S ribosome-binding factor RbfA [Rhodobacteraceae bacterium]|nr:30S ribosome-binding factor RbfA [Paracoccaceae bacterium]